MIFELIDISPYIVIASQSEQNTDKPDTEQVSVEVGGVMLQKVLNLLAEGYGFSWFLIY